MGFPTTHWTLLAKASWWGDAESRHALEELCRRYWMPIFRFIRSRGISEIEAQDLTQEFMLHILEKSIFFRADRFQGRFRSFLIGALIRFLGDAMDRRMALKRGGTVQHVSYDTSDMAAETTMASLGGDGAIVFDHERALTILERALKRVRGEYAETRHENELAVLKNFLPGGAEPPPYEIAAKQIGLSVPAFKSEIHRLRRRLRSLVREEVAQTVSAPHEIEAEMAHLQRVLMDRSSELFQRGEI